MFYAAVLLDQVTKEEVEFENQYSDWVKQYNDWKEQNKSMHLSYIFHILMFLYVATFSCLLIHMRRKKFTIMMYDNQIKRIYTCYLFVSFIG